jgi:large subunit ribosomal protein L21
MYAVIETGSKQYRVEVGTELQVELLDVEPGQTITLDRVLLVADGDTAAVGQPVVDGAMVSAEVLRRDRGEKLISFKYRPKARRRVKKGHRQELTILRVADIVFGGKSAAETVRKAQAAARTERQRVEEAAARQAAEDAALAAKLAKAAEPKTTDASARGKATGKAGTAAGKAGKSRQATTKPAATESASEAKTAKAKTAKAKTAKAKTAEARATEAKTATKRSAARSADDASGGGRTAGEKKDGPSGSAPRRGTRTKKDG